MNGRMDDFVSENVLKVTVYDGMSCKSKGNSPNKTCQALQTFPVRLRVQFERK